MRAVKSESIGLPDEVFMLVSDRREASIVQRANNLESHACLRRRFQFIRRRGETVTHEALLPDVNAAIRMALWDKGFGSFSTDLVPPKPGTGRNFAAGLREVRPCD